MNHSPAISGLFMSLLFHLSFSKSTSKPVCGEHLSGFYGSFTTPNYPNNYGYEIECQWVVEVPINHVIQLTFLDFDVEGIDTDDCDTDKVHVRDGEDSNGPLLGTILCGQTIPQMITSSGRFLFISFISDFISKGGRGFHATFVAKPAGDEVCITNACGGVIEDETSCIIQSPSYPSGYEANLNCSWLIKAPRSLDKIALQFLALQLSSTNSMCSKNSVTLHDGANASAPIISESVCDLISNRLKEKILTSTGPVLFIHFVTSSASTFDKGFSARFTVLNSPRTTTILKISSQNVTTMPDNEVEIVSNPAMLSGLVIAVIVAVAILVFGILLAFAYVNWKRRNTRFNIHLREEDSRSDVNALISPSDSGEFHQNKRGKIIRDSETELMYQL